MDSERRNRTGLAQPYESCRIARPHSPWGARLWEESNLRPRASHARVLSSELQRQVLEWGRTESNCQSRRRVVYSHLGSPHSQCIPMLRALGRIRTPNHQVRSLALWSIELRGRDVVHVRVEDAGIEPACRPGCKPSDHSQQSHPPKLSEYRQRESNPHGESPLVSETSASTHSAMPVCVGAARGWRESNSRPTARQADALPLSHTP